jgi:hypothetical protein
VDSVFDLASAVPKRALFAAIGVAVVGAVLAAAFGGASVAGAAAGIGALVVASAGALLALRVHVDRMPLTIAPICVEGRIDGHRALSFRARLGRGRRVDRASARVVYVPPAGAPIELPLLAPRAGPVLGPWTIVAVDRSDLLPASGGRFEVEVDATEGPRAWSARRALGADIVVAGRFVPAVARRAGRLVPDARAWDAIERAR